MKHMYTRLTKCSGSLRLSAVALLCLLSSEFIHAQYFSQNFDTSNVVTYYVNASTPTAAQFNAIAVTTGTTSSITGGKLQFSRANNGAGAATRTSNFSPTPTVLIVKFDLTISGSHSNNADLGRIAIGTNFTTGTALESTANTYAYLHVEGRGSNSFRVETDGDNSADQASGSTISITWAMNNSGFTINYIGPNGSNTSLSNDRVDCWIGTTRFASGDNVTTTSGSLHDMKFVLFGGTSTNMLIDNINVTSLPPVITTQPSSQAACEGSSVSFTSVATGSTSLQWEKFISGVWTPLAGKTTSPLVINPAGGSDDGSYRAVFSSTTGGTSVSNTAVLTIEIQSDGGNVVGDANACANVNSGTMSLINEVGSVLKWQSSVSPFTTWSDITNTTLSHNYSNLTVTTKFRAIVKNGTCPNDTSSLGTITVYPALVQYSITGSNSYCAGGSGVVLGLSGSELDVDYQFFRNSIAIGSPLAGTGSALSFGNQTLAGNYTVVATHTILGCSAQMGAMHTLSIHPLPSINSITATPSTICLGQSSNLASNGVSNSLAQQTFTSSTSSVGMLEANPSGISKTIDLTGAGLPTSISSLQNLRVVININHTKLDEVEVYLIRPGGTISTTASTPYFNTISNGGSICLVADRGGSNDHFVNVGFSDAAATSITTASYSFDNGTYRPENAFSTLSGNPNGIWTVKAIDDGGGGNIGSFISWSLIFDLPNGVSYTWTSTPAGFTSSVQNPGPVSPLVNTTYTVEVADIVTNCSASSSTSVNVSSVVATGSVINHVSCNGGSNGSVSVSGSGGVAPYVVSGNPLSGLSAGTYNYTVTDVNGCTGSTSVTINEPTAVIATCSVVSDASCFGSSDGEISVSGSGGVGPYTVSGGPLTGLSAGTYTYTVTDASNCTATCSSTIAQPALISSVFSVTACDSETLPWAQTVTVSGNYPHTYTAANGCDSVVTAQVTINNSNSSTSTVFACDSYTWNGNTYTSSGTYTAGGFTNAAGCDSTANLILTVGYSNTSTSTEDVCDSYTWNGNTYTTSGTYTYTTSNAAGCDSVATLNLTVRYSSVSSATEDVCDTYTWNGTTYTSSGVYTYSTVNAVGCDSTATLNLTIRNSNSSTSTVFACDSYTWNGNTYTSSGTYTAGGFTNAAGCDSTANLILTVGYSNTSTSTEDVCDSYTWNGNTYTTSGTYTYTTSNAAGCDSVATLNLTVRYSSVSSATEDVCDTYTWNGTTYTSSGVYTYSTVNAVGCDSTATLNLTIRNSNSSTSTVFACDSYTWNGNTYTSSGTYTAGGFTNAAGCDSTANLILTVGYSNTSTSTEDVCDSYTWNGNTYTTSGTYTYTTSNAAGCDSVATLNLTVRYSSVSSATEDVCDTYTWNGTTYTSSGVYTYSTVNAVGCDSTATLNLTVRYSSTSSSTVNACDSYTWNGTTYTSSGTYTYSTLNAQGCDSTATLVLTITTSTSNSSTASACDSYTWSVNGQTYTASGTYTDVVGCHTETLVLTITASTSNSTTASACDSYTWSVNGQTYTASGTYTDVVGCHTETLVLTITATTSNSTTLTACDSYTWSVNGQTYTASGTYTDVVG
ncbi:MAG: hypothetical protein EYC69_08780, partial [Bacteroidetes bacterium]